MKKVLVLLLAVLHSCFVSAQSSKYPSSSWLKITVDCKVGFIDPEGNVMIEPQFENAGQFHDGVAFVWYYIGREEDMKNVPLGEEYKSQERLNLQGNRRTGIIDSTGTYIIEPKINFNGTHFNEGVSLVRIDKSIEVVDIKGEIVSSESQIMKGEESNTLLIARYNEALPVKWCFVNALKELMIGPFDKCELFSGDLALVKMGKLYGYVNRNGNMVIPPKFYMAQSFYEGYATVAVEKEPGSTTYGIIDTSGTFVILPNYAWLGTLSEGRVPYRIMKDGQPMFGYLNMKGEVVIEAQYTQASPFNEGLAAVRMAEKEGYINIHGEIVIPFKYTRARTFENGSAFVSIGKNKSALINTKGEILWGPYKQKSCY